VDQQIKLMASENRILRIKELHQSKSKSLFLRFSLGFAILSLAWAWSVGTLHESVVSKEQRGANLEKFIGKIIPDPTRESGQWIDSLPWMTNLLTEGQGIKAAGITFGIATVAITLSGFFALLLLPLSARNFGTQRPLEIIQGKHILRSMYWFVINKSSRILFLFTRSLPEYVLGFLLISILGPDPWVLVLALAIHNFGILGRLGSELVENNSNESARIMFAQGGGRYSSFVSTILPDSFNRMLVYFFYRWETCIRESTVLGMLGIVSLGYLINDAKAGRDFDRMLTFILLGALIVIIGDIISSLVRHKLRITRSE
jgi:phosphonate transport system permease protein